jgi:hypothetical protein
MKFHLGQVLSTPTISHAMSISPIFAKFLATSLERHQNIDSDVCKDDQELNKSAVIDGGRIFSSYKISDKLKDIIDSDKIWIITEATNHEGNRRYTTILLPSEY